MVLARKYVADDHELHIVFGETDFSQRQILRDRVILAVTTSRRKRFQRRLPDVWIDCRLDRQVDRAVDVADARETIAAPRFLNDGAKGVRGLGASRFLVLLRASLAMSARTPTFMDCQISARGPSAICKPEDPKGSSPALNAGVGCLAMTLFECSAAGLVEADGVSALGFEGSPKHRAQCQIRRHEERKQDHHCQRNCAL